MMQEQEDCGRCQDERREGSLERYSRYGRVRGGSQAVPFSRGPFVYGGSGEVASSLPAHRIAHQYWGRRRRRGSHAAGGIVWRDRLPALDDTNAL